jgi:hypothetical protein
MELIHFSKVPLIGGTPGTLYPHCSFPEDTKAQIKKLFPGITKKKINAMEHLCCEHLYIEEQVMRMELASPSPTSRQLAKELHDIQTAVETLQGLLANANSTTGSVLDSAYIFEKSAPTGVTDKKYPRLKDVEVVLEAFKQSMYSADNVRSYVEYSKKVKACLGTTNRAGRPSGGAADYPGKIIEELSDILYPDDGMLGQTEGVKLGKILRIPELLTEKYIKDWRSMKKGLQGPR